MINRRLSEILSGKEDNYLLPFYWQHGQHEADYHTEQIPAQVERIYQSGCKALCVESRTHEDFCKDGWWRDMDIILSECKKRNMKVWILDDKHFPTGYANGGIQEKHPELRKWFLIERHIDVMGPMKAASILVESDTEEHFLISAAAFLRSTEDEKIIGEPIDLTANRKGNYLYWDIPKGCYRIFLLFKSRRGTPNPRIDMISKESVQVLIDEVYEPHWEHYKEYFGNTIAGFFSDEPCFDNHVVGPHTIDSGMYDRRIGTAGLALPYNENLLSMMCDALGYDALSYLGELWYEGDHAPQLRHAYMDAVTKLYSECFNYTLGNWCREHGVMYIGHIIEDMNAHAHLQCSGGHFFRSLDGQDMSGIDIVLHQVMPGFANYTHTASCFTNAMDAEFFHYVLGKLAASHAHQNPRMQGKAMCEVFGAYGWGEGSIMMKWLMDFLLVRGVNHFVPHAFSPDYPDPDCPPHFGAEGHDPQFPAFTKLMAYTNQASHLLCGADHIAPAAILYHAEGEWMSDKESMLTQKPAKVLYDTQIDYDILSIDMLMDTSVENGKLCCGNEIFHALIIPYAKHLPKAFCDRLTDLEASGLPVWFIDGLPMEKQGGKTVALGDLVGLMQQNQFTDTVFIPADANEKAMLRTYHCKCEDTDILMLFNESYAVAAVGKLTVLGCAGKYNRLRLLEDGAWLCETKDGMIDIELQPGQSEILIFGGIDENLPAMPCWEEKCVLSPNFTIEIAESDDLSDWKYYDTTDTLYNLTAADKLPDFSGLIHYSGHIVLEDSANAAMLDLGQVAQYAKLTVNGIDCGMRICPPYRFDLSGILTKGANKIEIEVGNTLAQKVKDGFSYFLTLEPAGILGDIRLYTQKEK